VLQLSAVSLKNRRLVTNNRGQEICDGIDGLRDWFFGHGAILLGGPC
jgi:hypothetical protein